MEIEEMFNENTTHFNELVFLLSSNTNVPISTLLVFWNPPFLKPLPSCYCEVKASKAGCQEIESLKKLPA
jgi:hypothetical protein